MIWLTWRQSRTQLAVAGIGLVIVALALLITGPHLLHLYDTSLASCRANGDCAGANSSFLAQDRGLQLGLDALVIVVPAIIGLFWGAPLVARELEAGTQRLAWTQSVTRVRWVAVKLGALGAASMATAGLLSLAVTWWSSPFDRANMNVFMSFDQRDIVPVGYAAFAFALGCSAGVVIRRILPAMAATLAGFIAVRLVMDYVVRPHLIAPVVRTFALDPSSTGFGSMNGGPLTLQPNPPDIPNAWIYSTQIVDKAGHGLPAGLLARTCPRLPVPGAGTGTGRGPGPLSASVSHQAPAPAGVQQVFQECVTKVAKTYHGVLTYQPGSRYWTFQGYELALYLVLAAALAGLCFWWVRHRLA
jgi:ABC-type transport system involved in multi-copper enzyme maturation permease subunit